MTLKTTAKALKSALTLIAPTINPKHPVNAMTCVVFDGQTIRGGNFDMEISVPFVADIDQPFAIDFARLKSLASSIVADASIVMTPGEKDVAVKFGRSRYKLPTVNPDDVYSLGDVIGAAHEPKDGFASKLTFCATHAGEHASMPVLSGVQMSGQNMCGTTGLITGWTVIDDCEMDVVIPAPLCAIVTANGTPLSITASDAIIEMQFGTHTVKSKMMGDKYPNWKPRLPTFESGCASFSIVNDQFMSVVRRIQSVGSMRGSPQLTMVSDGTIIAIGTLDSDGRMARELLIEGSDLPVFEVSMACGLALTAMDAHPKEAMIRVHVGTNDKRHPVMIKSDVDSQSIIMPLIPLTPTLGAEILTAFTDAADMIAEAA